MNNIANKKKLAIKGYILLPVSFAIILIAAIAFLTSQESAMEVNMAANDLDISKADYIAAAGMQHTLHDINQSGCGPYTDLVDYAFSEGSYSSTITTNAVGGNVTTYTIPVIADAYIKQSTADQNYGSATELETYFRILPTDTHRSLFRFDIENAGIPDGAQILSALAKIHVIDKNSKSSVTIHRITADWDESSVTWDNINAEHDSSSIGSIPKDPATDTATEINLTAVVQGWLNGSTANQGIMLKTTFLDDLAKYASKEHGDSSKHPVLEVRVMSGTISNKASVDVTATLPNGVTRDTSRKEQLLYQYPGSNLVWQPGIAIDDAYVRHGEHKDKNFGVSDTLIIEKDNKHNVFIRFPLQALPPNAKIKKASLELYLSGGNAISDGVLDIYKINKPWIEGIHDDETPSSGEGATYETYDGGNNWDNTGGDYDSNVVDSITIPDLTEGWYTWDVTEQVIAWFDGEPNYGLHLRENGGNVVKIEFVSSDNKTTPELTPRLTIELSCLCGTVCMIPQGSGNLLLVVADSSNLAASEIQKIEIFNSWGYNVNLINHDSSQDEFDTALTNNDLAYISESVSSTTIANKLTSTTKGVVNEEGALNDELGIASAAAQSNSKTLTINDTGHYITSLFAANAISIFDAYMEGISISGTVAPDARLLGNWGSTGGLVTLDSGATLYNGDTAAGRRIMVPIGRANDVNFDYVNNNGRLLLQRSIQWAADQQCPTQWFSRRIASSTDDAEEQSAFSMELERDELNLGQGPLLLLPTKVGLRFQGIPFDADTTIMQAYIEFTAKETDSAPTDLVIHGEADDNAETFNNSFQNISNRILTNASINWDNLSEWSTVGELHSSPNLSSIVQEVFNRPNWKADNAMAFIINGTGFRMAKSYDHSVTEAPLLRIQYCGDPIPAPTPLAHWKLDETSGTTAVDEQGKYDGSLQDGPAWNTSGKINGALSFDGIDDRVVVNHDNALSLTSAFTITAWVNNQDSLMFSSYRIISKEQTGSNDSYWMAISGDYLYAGIGGEFFTPNITFETNRWYHLAMTYDDATDEVKIYVDGKLEYQQTTTVTLNSNTADLQIGNNWENTKPWLGLIDDVRLYDQVLQDYEISEVFTSTSDLGGGSEPLTGGSCNGTFLDQFNSKSYSNNDGSLNWSNDWQEINESDGAGSGDIQVRSDKGDNRLRTRDNDNGGEGVEREVDLSGAGAATLSYDYRRDKLDNSSDYTSVEISGNGASGPWIELVRHQGPNNDGNYQNANHDISAYISANTRIRFKTSANMGNSDTVYLDNVQIQCSP